MSITLRVPVAGFSDVLDELAGIAPIVTRQISTEDVTAQMVDLTSRVQTMAASVAQGRVLLSKATKIGDVIEIEGEVNQREADLESLQRQQAALAGQTALSTITVVLRGSVTGVKVPPPPTSPEARSGFFGGLANGWDALRHIGHAVLTVIGTLIPFLPILAVVVLGLLYWQRKFRRTTPPVLATQPGDPHPTD